MSLHTFQVYPDVPQSISFIETLLKNMWWCWNLDAIELFRRVSPQLWEQAGRNPIIFATLLPQATLEELSKEKSLLAHQERVKQRFDKQINAPSEYSQKAFGEDGIIAYLSMEFGIHESLPLYSGGLGILAGDHLKAASDMGLPLVGVSLLHRRGYFHQYLNQDGWQQEEYPETDLFHLGIIRAKDPKGNKITITLNGPEGDFHAILWEIRIGRIPLYLLDTNIPENPPHLREITSRLYAGEQKIRLYQEILLGIGGMRALEALGHKVVVVHMNEGHCTFAGLERLSQTIAKYKVDIKTASEIVAKTTVFTTHTPVPAGHDDFPADMVRPFMYQFQDKLGLTIEQILAWGQHQGANPHSAFHMFLLGIRLAQYVNGVSKLHGLVARKMWSNVWTQVPEDEVPITYVTNGIHIPSWISIENSLLFERYIGPDWALHTDDPDIIKRIDFIYDEELWRAHELSRSRLIRHCRKQMVKQYGRRNAPRSMMKDAESVLDQDILTIAFARRFATYKRANLLLHDPERFEAILSNKDYPVQFIFAGKAHPKDHEGKELIQRIIQFAKRASARHRIIFIEDYEINIARHLVQGADIWLNNPRRPFEACGTSGMKAAVNGVLNLSILDGWWCEGYTPDRGWRIGGGEEYSDHAYQDSVEAQALYNVLENEVIPCFYDRKHGNAPTRWIYMMKESMKMAMRDFSSLKMIQEYEKRFYGPAAESLITLVKDDAKEAKELNRQHERLKTLWRHIKIETPAKNLDGPFRVGNIFYVTVKVHLGEIKPNEVSVQLYYGTMKTVDSLSASNWEEMTVTEDLGSGNYIYGCSLRCSIAGRYGFTVRAVPKGDEWIKNTPGLITWV